MSTNHSLQDGLSGPTSTVLGALGIQLPDNADDDEDGANDDTDKGN